MSLFNKVFQKHLDEHNAAFAEPANDEVETAPEVEVDYVGEQIDQVETETPPVTPPVEAENFGPDPDLVARAAEAQQMMQQARSAPVSYQDPAPGAPAVSRNKTRILGFNTESTSLDPFAEKQQTPTQTTFPCGWLVITDGPGRGASFSLHSGVAQIGRGEGQAIQLDFGDMAISREHHAAVAYDAETGKFFLGHGGKSNIIRLNARPVLSTEEMTHGDTLKIGETELRFIALCDANFAWSEGEN